MKTPKELLPKPSDAIQAMVDGLREVSKRNDFIVNMETFGTIIDNVCHGCAATSVVLKCFPDAPVSTSKRYNEYYEIDGWAKFESVINELRIGDIDYLFDYYDLFDQIIYPIQPLPQLETDNWESGLPAYEAYAKQLRDLGL